MARSLVSCLVPCALITQLGACLQQLEAPDAQATVVDRREGDWAVVQHLKDGRIEHVPLSTLPPDVRDGEVVVRNQRAAELRELLLTGQRRLREPAAHGSFSLEDPPAPRNEARQAPSASSATPGLTPQQLAASSALRAPTPPPLATTATNRAPTPAQLATTAKNRVRAPPELATSSANQASAPPQPERAPMLHAPTPQEPTEVTQALTARGER